MQTHTKDMMTHVMAKSAGVNTKGRLVGGTRCSKTSRVVLKKPTLVIHLPGGGTTKATSLETRTAKAKVTQVVQWFDPMNRGKYHIATRKAVTGITGKLSYQGQDASGKPVWA